MRRDCIAGEDVHGELGRNGALGMICQGTLNKRAIGVGVVGGKMEHDNVVGGMKGCRRRYTDPKQQVGDPIPNSL
jgi:hypothetical protein